MAAQQLDLRLDHVRPMVSELAPKLLLAKQLAFRPQCGKHRRELPMSSALTRRYFLRGAVGAGCGILLAACDGAAAPSSSTSPKSSAAASVGAAASAAAPAGESAPADW